jgi:predicted site-specific integrase-resolvase
MRAVSAPTSRCQRLAIRSRVMMIGYGRVSTRDQNPDAQLDALTGAVCDQVFIDSASGKLASRPELDKALMVAREGDQFVVTKLDRLGGSLEHLISLSNGLQEQNVALWSWIRASTPPPPWAGCSSRSSVRSPSSSTP